MTRSPTEAWSAWQKAYRFALINAALFFSASMCSLLLSITSIEINCAVAAIFFIGSTASALALFRAAQGLVAIAFFVAGAGLLFGFGTAYAPFAPSDEVLTILFHPDEQRRMLGTINAINSTSVLLVLAASRLLIRPRGETGPSPGSLSIAVQSFSTYLPPLLAVSWVVVALQIATFPQPQDMLLRGALSTLGRLPLVVLIIVFSQWRRQGAGVLMLALLLGFAMSALGLASTSKLATLLPASAIVIAVALDPAGRRAALILGSGLALLYFMWLAPLATDARHRVLRSGAPETLASNIQALRESSAASEDTETGRIGPMAARFSSAPYQSFLINRFNAGLRGHSLDDSWTALVPRAVWPDKPNITRFGAELYSEINRRAGRSQLAPSYTGEAYWNYGWPGVVIVSVILGLQLGWFSMKWLSLAAGDTRKVGILAVSIPVAFNYFWVESWISASFVGGFITLVLMIKAVDFAATSRLGSNAGLPRDVGHARQG